MGTTTKTRKPAPRKTPAKTTPPAKPSVPAYETFANYFSVYFSDMSKEKGWLTDLYNASKKYYGQGFTDQQIPDLVLSDKDAPASYKNRFAGIFELKKKQAAGENITHIPSVAQYATMSKELKKQFNKFELNGLGTDETIAKIIGNDVDLEEATARLTDAFYSIDNADKYLKQQLADNFPSLSRGDLAKALLTGKEGSVELKKKIDVAGIKASAAEFGLQNQASAEELLKMGVTRSDARKGYAQTQQELAGLQAAQEQFGKTANIAKELENVNVLGKNSGEVKRLKSQARGRFQGSTGVRTTSLAKSKVGQI